MNMFTTQLGPKRLGLLRELVPTAALTAVLIPAHPVSPDPEFAG